MTTPDPTSPYATGAPVPPASESLLLPQPPAPKRKNRLPLILLAAGAALFVVVLTVVITLAAGSGTPAAKPTAASAWDRGQSATATPVDEGEVGVPTDQPTPGPTLHASDITLSLKTTSKECFGYGFGCSLTVQVKMSLTGMTPDAADTWQVTYEIRGIKNAPLVGSFEVTGETYESNEEFVDTTGSKVKPTIKVTSVDKVGI